MIYCMSDIHGEINRFHRMLDMIQISPADTLYIFGDVIDRYPGGVDILREIMTAPNMQLLLGNHEDMCLKTLGSHSGYGARQRWQSNGGSSTYRELLYHLTEEARRQILSFLLALPDHFDIEVNGRAYHLVHGWPSKERENRIWGRPMDHLPWCLDHGVTAIIGHTPTVYLSRDTGEGPFQIYHSSASWIDIDCGCGNRTPRRRLACLRLDDMEEFYS